MANVTVEVINEEILPKWRILNLTIGHVGNDIILGRTDDDGDKSSRISMVGKGKQS